MTCASPSPVGVSLAPLARRAVAPLRPLSARFTVPRVAAAHPDVLRTFLARTPLVCAARTAVCDIIRGDQAFGICRSRFEITTRDRRGSRRLARTCAVRRAFVRSSAFVRRDRRVSARRAFASVVVCGAMGSARPDPRHALAVWCGLVWFDLV